MSDARPSLAIPNISRGHSSPGDVAYREFQIHTRSAVDAGVTLDQMIVAVYCAHADQTLPDSELYAEAKRVADDLIAWVPPRKRTATEGEAR